MPHLPYEELPPLADYDYADHLKARSFAELDPMVKLLKDKAAGREIQKSRHVLWSFLRVFGVFHNLS